MANKLGLSYSTLQSFRNDFEMLSPYRVHPNNTNKRTKKVKYTNFDNNSHREHDLEKPQMTSIDLRRPQSSGNENSKKVKTKDILESGFVREDVEINDQYLDEVLHNNDI